MKTLPAFGFVLALIFSTATMAKGPSTVPLHDTPQPLPTISFTDEHANPLTRRRRARASVRACVGPVAAMAEGEELGSNSL